MSYDMTLLEPFGVEIVPAHLQFTIFEIDPSLIKELILKYKIIVIRNVENILEKSLIKFAESIGPLLKWDFGAVMEMRVQADPKNYLFTHGAVPFHWDGAFYKEPKYLLFHCIDAPLASCGGETLFTNTNQIWLNARKSHQCEWRQIKLRYKTEKLAHYGGEINAHLVQQHPITNETILRFAEPVPNTMLNPVEVIIDNMDINLADKWLEDMATRCYSNEYCYEHTWRNNDVLIADNFSLIHARRAFKQFSPRFLRRIQIL